jgi:2,3-bisphosphoglycerate-independent phosphoglycerate mutase
MVGHTGSIPAAVKAVETVDECLGRIVDAVTLEGGVALITADHGNAEKMLESDGVSLFTAHTTNPVPLIVTDPEVALRDTGELADLVPSVLGLLGVEQPLQMTGKSLTTPD